MKSSSMNKSYYMIVKLFLCYAVTQTKIKKSKYRKYWWTEIQIQQIY